MGAVSVFEPLSRLQGERVLVTGAAGSVGAALVPVLKSAGIEHVVTDIAGDARFVDVCDPAGLLRVCDEFGPSVILHLAGAKHAPDGELNPRHVGRVNIEGTACVLAAAGGARVVMASTCKACDPETAYGASKLIAERMTLNAGGSVARFFNIPETCGNVFRLWEALPEDETLPVTECWRYFQSLERAVELVLWAAVLGPGRYRVDPGQALSMSEVAANLYPGRRQVRVARRRGDRTVEPLQALCESASEVVPGVLRVVNDHDRQRTRPEARELAGVAA